MTALTKRMAIIPETTLIFPLKFVSRLCKKNYPLVQGLTSSGTRKILFMTVLTKEYGQVKRHQNFVTFLGRVASFRFVTGSLSLR